MENYVQAFVTVVALVNPMMCGVMFVAIESGRTVGQRMKDASRVVAAIVVVLSLAALFGARVLDAFGISLDAFSVAGGGVLVWMGFSLLRSASVRIPSSAADANESKPSITSLILFAASPGTITGVITLAVAHSRTAFPATALFAVAGACLVAWLVMALLARSGQKPEAGFTRSIVQSFMGLIVMAMGVQFGLRGLDAFMHSTAG